MLCSFCLYTRREEKQNRKIHRTTLRISLMCSWIANKLPTFLWFQFVSVYTLYTLLSCELYIYLNVYVPQTHCFSRVFFFRLRWCKQLRATISSLYYHLSMLFILSFAKYLHIFTYEYTYTNAYTYTNVYTKISLKVFWK